jgi:excisionase family DNA binding protein
MKELGEFLTVDDLAKLLNVTKGTIHLWRKDNPSFPKSFSVGRKLLWRKADIDAYVESLLKDKNKDNNA